MTKEDQETEGLPTAAKCKERYDDETSYPAIEVTFTGKQLLQKEDELLRRKDVEALIEELFSNLDKSLQEYQQSSDRDIPYKVKTILDQHREEVLEEVKASK